MYFGVIASFSSVFLLARGYSNSEIGIILALANTISIIVQPFLAEWADRGRKSTIFATIEIITALNLVLSTVMMFKQERSFALTFSFILCYSLMMTSQPFINAVNRRLEETGAKIAFGTCRAIGSLAYAILCFFMGSLVEKYGTGILPPAGDFLLILIMLVVFLTYRSYQRTINMEVSKSSSAPKNTGYIEKDVAYIPSKSAGTATMEESREFESKEPSSYYGDYASDDYRVITLQEFIKSHRLFFIMSMGIMWLYFANTVPNAYMAQIVNDVGGDASDVGRILSLLALTELPTLILFDRLYKRFRTESMLKLASVAYVVWTLVHFLAKSVGMLLGAQMIHFLAFPLFLPAMVRFIDGNMREGEAVKGQTLFTVMVTIGNLGASLIGGLILDLAGAKTLLLIGVFAAIVGCAFIFLMIGRVSKEVPN